MQFLMALIRAGKHQKLGNQRGHLLCLVENRRKRFFRLIQRLGILDRIFALGNDHRGRRAQLMGGVGRKLFFRFKRFFQTGKHPVKFRRQRIDLIPPFSKRDAAR